MRSRRLTRYGPVRINTHSLTSLPGRARQGLRYCCEKYWVYPIYQFNIWPFNIYNMLGVIVSLSYYNLQA